MQEVTITSEVAVIGAGPYGLAAAAHLRAAGISTHVFGRPMEFWRRSMPDGMLLRSPWRGSHIADPAGALSLDRYCGVDRTAQAYPIPIQRFIRYGEWFQENAVPDLDKRLVKRIKATGAGFRLLLEDGSETAVRRVVIATGMKDYARRPQCFVGVSSAFATHASENHDFRKFGGRSVAVIGAGQSAVETAALLREAGAEVELIARTHHLHWMSGPGSRHTPFSDAARRALLALSPAGEIGPFPFSWLIEYPQLFRRMKPDAQQRLSLRALHPCVAGWVWPRVQGLALTMGRGLKAAVVTGDRLRIVLEDDSERIVEHAVLATGYSVDLSRHEFLPPGVLAQIARLDGSPLLTNGFESSVKGLHFIGAAAVQSFGPVMRFVWGTRQASRGLVRGIRGQHDASLAAAA